MLHTRFIDFYNRAAIRINPDNVYIVNRGNGSNNANGSNVNYSDSPPVPLYSSPGQWYDVLVRTVGDAMLVWIKEQDGIYGDWDTAITYLPPILAVDNLQTDASNYLRLILGADIARPHPFGGLRFDNLELQTVSCGGMPPALYTPCDDVVISEIFPHVPTEPMCADENCEYQLVEPWVEFWNPGSSPIDISGWGLSNSMSSPVQYTLPSGSYLNPGYTVIVFSEDVNSPYYRGFTLAGSDTLALLCNDGAGEKSVTSEFKIAHYVIYPILTANQSYSLALSGGFNFWKISVPTPSRIWQWFKRTDWNLNVYWAWTIQQLPDPQVRFPFFVYEEHP